MITSSRTAINQVIKLRSEGIFDHILSKVASGRFHSLDKLGNEELSTYDV